MADERRRRIAANEVRFRDINEQLRTGLRTLPADDGTADFICECGLTTCTDTMAMTLAEYERVRDHPRHFAVLPGHEIPDTEEVVATGERFLTVCKRAPGAPIAEATDPRAPRG